MANRSPKLALRAALKDCIDHAPRPTLTAVGELLAQKAEWDDERRRILIKLHGAGITSELFPDEQAKAVKDLRDSDSDKDRRAGDHGPSM